MMFLSTNKCDGSGDCIKQCPTKAIRYIGGKAFSCLTCGKCYEACPNDAIFKNNYGGYVVDRAKCNACGICMHSCPIDNIKIEDGVTYGICSRCGVCMEACPNSARVDGFELTEEKHLNFIKSLNFNLPPIEVPKKSEKKVVTRGYFGTNYDDCIFCGRCQDKCPTNAIKVHIDRDEGICTQCRACVDACSNGSITKQLIINHDTCTLCLNCVKNCPHDAITIGDFEVNINGINQKSAGSIVSCLNCGLCAELSENNSLKRINNAQRYDPTADIGETVEKVHEVSIGLCPVSTLKEDENLFIFDEVNNAELPTLSGFCVSCGTCVNACDVQGARVYKVATWDGSISDDCISCGICYEVCPEEAITLNRGSISVNLDKCILCERCAVHCPVDAIPRSTMHKRIIDSGFCFIDEKLCINCGLCYKTCSYDAIIKKEDGFEVNDEKCKYCGACKNACPSNAFIFERNFKDSTEGI